MTARPSLPNPTPRCGRRSGLVRQGGDGLSVAYTGSRLTTSVGYRGDKPLRHPTLATYNPHAFGFAGRYHCALRLIPTSKVLVPAALARYLRRCRSAYGSLRCNRVSARADTRLTVTMPAQCSVNACPATPNGSPAHTQCSNRLVASLPLLASPVLSLRSEVVGGVSLPEVLHFAHRTLCFSPPIEHTPTSPNHEITPSSLEVVSIDDFRSAKILEKAEAKVSPPKPKLRFGSSSHIGELTAHSARCEGEFLKCSAGRSGGLCRQHRGIAPNPIKGCETAF